MDSRSSDYYFQSGNDANEAYDPHIMEVTHYDVPTAVNGNYMHATDLTTADLVDYVPSQLESVTGNEEDHQLNNFALNAFEHVDAAHETDENSVELMAQFAADLANATVTDVGLYATPKDFHVEPTHEQQQRALLQSSMSPLLAAVNDITSRDPELQLYLSQHLEKDSQLPVHELQTLQTVDELDNGHSDCLLVADKPALCSANASLLPQHLQFEAVDAVTNELTICAKEGMHNCTKCDPHQIDNVVHNSESPVPMLDSPDAIVNDGSQYLKLSPLKPRINTSVTSEYNSNTTTSSSNRRKQTPTKLKAVESNTETMTYFALSEMLKPFLISEHELHEEFKKTDSYSTNVVPEKFHTAAHTNCRENTEIATMPTEQLNGTDESRTNINSVNEVEPDMQNLHHVEDQNASAVAGNSTQSKNCDLNRFYPFKCPLCNCANFKRRGILVNHIAKMHPQTNLNDIPALSMPVLKPQLVFPCPYCRTHSYKSNAKRKAHILKNHPGKELPMGLRESASKAEAEVETVGNVESAVHKCALCRRQYVARTRLLHHYRKMHPDAKLPSATLTEPKKILSNEFTPTKVYPQEALQCLEPEINAPYAAVPVSPENKLLELSSAALELSRLDFLMERGLLGATDDLSRLPALFDESPLASMDAHSIEMEFFEKIGKL